MSVFKRLYLLVAISIAGLVVVASLSAYQTARVFETTNYANVNTVPSLIDLNEAYFPFSMVRIAIWQHIASTDPAQMEELAKKMVHRTFPGKAALIFRKKYAESLKPYAIRLMTLMRLLTPSRMLVFRAKRADASIPRRYLRKRLAKAMAGAMPLSIAI